MQRDDWLPVLLGQTDDHDRPANTSTPHHCFGRSDCTGKSVLSARECASQKPCADTLAGCLVLGPCGLVGGAGGSGEEKVEEREGLGAQSRSDKTEPFPRNQDGESVCTGSSAARLLKRCRWRKRIFSSLNSTCLASGCTRGPRPASLGQQSHPQKSEVPFSYRNYTVSRLSGNSRGLSTQRHLY